MQSNPDYMLLFSSWYLNLDTGNLLVTGVQPSNAVKSRLHVIVFILVFKSGHRQFTCHRCPNLNLSELSESQSDALTGWPHSSQDKIPCVFPEFSLC